MDLDALIVGGGVVGLAVAAELAARVPRVALLERHAHFGEETSSRNSEVVHAGLYYEPGSLKARLCVEGRRLLCDMAGRVGLPYVECGKIVVSVDAEEDASLEALAQRGRANGADGLQFLSRAQLHAREPNVRARMALLSPRTAILDSHRLLSALGGVARDRGAMLVTSADVVALEPHQDGWRVAYRQAGAPDSVAVRAVVNCAGLGAQQVMILAGLDPSSLGLVLHLCKGDYFALRGSARHIVNGLVYPSPQAELVGLGIHTVVDLAGDLKLGPDATYIDGIDYSVDPARAASFYTSVRRFLPGLRLADLEPAMSGIRPKLAGPGEPARDFHIAHEIDHDAAGFFNLAGIESPGLTASPAIGRLVAEMVTDWLET
jgi:L-2-hydroxyglutarate oxidase LhgO